MPRETLDIKLFNYGIYSKPDAQDIPLESASDSDNVDGDLYEGRLGGIPANANFTTYGWDALNYAWLKRNNGKWDLVYNSGDTIHAIQAILDFYGTPAQSSLILSGNGVSIVAQNQSVHIGIRSDSSPYNASAPKWAGWIEYGQFGGSAPTSDLTSGDAELVRPSNGAGSIYVSSKSINSGTGVFDSLRIYEYCASMVYDGFQESPLGSSVVTYTPSSEGNGSSIDLTITANTISSLSKRVSAVKVYRREKDTTTGNYTLWRLLGTLDITGTTGTTEGGKSYTWSGTTSKTCTLNDDNSYIGGTYEAETGLPETLTSSIVYYEISTDINNYLFVGRCVKTGIPDASRYIFRSKSYRYDMFDWTNDYLILPTIPLAMKSFNGRLYIWDENDTYIINPETLEIEDIINGMGCLSSRSVAVTEYGMFWCDRKNAYWQDGRTTKVISEPIKSTDTTKDWHGFSKLYNSSDNQKLFNYTPIVVFNSQKNIVLFMILASDSQVVNVWAYNVLKNRWDKFLNFEYANSSSGAIVGREGEVYFANSHASSGSRYLLKLMSSTSKRVFTWYSQNITFGDVGQKKAFYHLLYDYSGSAPASFQYSVDNGSTWRSLTNTTEIKDSNGFWEKKKTLKIKIVGNANGTTIINNIGIVFRRFVGKRD